MRKAEQVLKDCLKEKLIPGSKRKLHEWNYSITTKEIMEVMKEYAREAVIECINVPSIMYQEQLKDNLP